MDRLPVYLLASVAISWTVCCVFTLPGVMAFFERHLLEPIAALLVIGAVWGFLTNPNLMTVSRVASFLHSDAGY
ncbi:hypothetical protein [Rhizobium leguminosarum]